MQSNKVTVYIIWFIKIMKFGRCEITPDFVRKPSRTFLATFVLALYPVHKEPYSSLLLDVWPFHRILYSPQQFISIILCIITSLSTNIGRVVSVPRATLSRGGFTSTSFYGVRRFLSICRSCLFASSM